MLRMVSDEQVRRLLKLRKREKTLATAAAKAGMDEKTARKWLGSEKLPSQCKIERCSRRRADPFSEVWSEMEGILERAPTVQAVQSRLLTPHCDQCSSCSWRCDSFLSGSSARVFVSPDRIITAYAIYTPFEGSS